ncbi:MAG: hypothetical protein FJW35_18805, partial [Acidobacteria bacterium]|nr:hypothetical protein [Acidobacteriota bacterium]
MSRRRITCSNALLFSLFLFSRLPEIRAETTIAVSATADDIVVNGNCTLREAIIAANTDSAVDGCPAGSGADTILLPAGVYMLALAGPGEDASRSGDLDVSGDVTIRGAGATATMILAKKLPLALSDRVIHVLDGGRLTLLGATIRGGVCGRGGGIFNAGQLFIEDCHIQGNQANEGGYCGPPGGGGAIFNQGDLAVTRSTISGNEALGSFGRFDVATPGGGVLNRGRAVIERSVLSGNYAAGGGGIWSQGDLHVADTQISSNGARFYAAALENYGSAMLTRVTISGNVDGGILNDGGPLILLNSTISGNTSFRISGAVHNRSGPIEISSSTVAGNISVPD